MKVYAFGDSHAGKFCGDPRFICGDAQQATAHNLINENSESQSWFALQQHLYIYDPEDIFMFVIGEIDCRIHFYRQHVITGKSYHELMDNTVRRYGHIVKAVRDDGRPNVAVLDIPPAMAQGNEYGYDHYADRDTRAAIIIEFNDTLAEWCEANDIYLVCLWPYIADGRGWLKEEYAVGDGAHVSENAVPLVVAELTKRWPELCE